MNKIDKILRKYTDGEYTLEVANEKLKNENSNLVLDPVKNIITEKELGATVVGTSAKLVNGYGLLDIGVGNMDKVFVKDGVLENCDCGEMAAFVHIKGKTYEVRGTKLVD